jgi:hypothetical protein
MYKWKSSKRGGGGDKYIFLVHIIETMLFQIFGKLYVEIIIFYFLDLEYENMFIFIVYNINISI